MVYFWFYLNDLLFILVADKMADERTHVEEDVARLERPLLRRVFSF